MSVVYDKRARRTARRKAFFGSIFTNVQSASVGCSMLYYYAKSDLSDSNVWGFIRILLFSVALAAYALWALARYQLGASLTFGELNDGPLVTTGLYAKFRNPIYVFGTASLTFYLLAISRPIWLLILLVLLPMQYVRSRREHWALMKKYDDRYEAYLQHVWM